MNEADYLRLLTRQAEQTNDFLSTHVNGTASAGSASASSKPSACPIARRISPLGTAAGRPVQGVPASRVFFVLDEGRRLNEKWREELTRRRQAVSLRQLIRREERPQRIAAAELQARLAPTLRKKAHNYYERGIDHGELDLLAFVNLKRAVPDFNTPFPPPTEYLRQGWRSLSMVDRPLPRVLFAPPAPRIPAPTSDAASYSTPG